jgi:hypothetical protein
MVVILRGYAIRTRARARKREMKNFVRVVEPTQSEMLLLYHNATFDILYTKYMANLPEIWPGSTEHAEDF